MFSQTDYVAAGWGGGRGGGFGQTDCGAEGWGGGRQTVGQKGGVGGEG